jgi:hypothetical protein
MPGSLTTKPMGCPRNGCYYKCLWCTCDYFLPNTTGSQIKLTSRLGCFSNEYTQMGLHPGPFYLLGLQTTKTTGQLRNGYHNSAYVAHVITSNLILAAAVHSSHHSNCDLFSHQTVIFPSTTLHPQTPNP